MTPWKGDEDLPLGRTLLLEASAGTGKTWQIEGLVIRLVAEYEVPIDRVLVITFTNAATAELRKRIRQRLVEARDAMAHPVAPTGNPILEKLWAEAGKRANRRSLLATAVSSFDLAPISTIHGFSQRMLDQLAFESGQEPGLELMADPDLIVQQLVDDEVARVFADATEEELDLLDDMGWTRGQLGKLAQAMTKAVEPVLEPTPAGVDLRTVRPLDPVRTWLKAKTTLRSWLDATEGQAAIDAVRDELDRKKGKRVKNMPRAVVGKHLAALKDWLDGPALRSRRAKGPGLPTSVRNLELSALVKAWTGNSEEMKTFEGTPLFQRVSALLAGQDQLWPQALVGFASRARQHVHAELVRSGWLTYSTMLSRLAERIAAQAEQDGQEGPLAQAIRSRFDVALVDEFQDTDGAQWPVMRAVFAHPTRRLVIIGDPKQAIYAFRGADVHVYLDAARVAHKRATMRTNWRSDAPCIAAMNHVWAQDSGAFDLADVDYIDISAAPANEAPRIRGLPAQEDRPRRAFELRWVDGETLGTSSRLVGNKAVGQDATARLAALEAVRLLEGSTEIRVEREGDREPVWRGLRPGDIAVLVRTNDQAERVRRRLERLGIPSVSAGRGSVMASPVLGWLCTWLDAVAAPGRDRPARALATTPLFGWTALDLATAISAADAASDAELSKEQEEAKDRWECWLRSIQIWAGVWPTRGFVRVFEGALDHFGVVRRLLGARQGERYATDLRHLVELCHAQERRTRVGPSGLASWLRASRDAAGDGSDEAQALRLESDARAVQLVTIHKSKGLEYPVVLLPFGWADFQPSDGGGPLEWHARVGERVEIRLNLELRGTGNRQRAAAQAALETRQEQLRLLYVALTRARHHCVAWLGPLGKAGIDTNSHALGRIVLRERDAKGTPVEGGTSPVFPKTSSKDPKVRARVAAEQEAVWDEIQDRFDLLASTSRDSVGWSIEPSIEDREPISLEIDATEALDARPWPDERPLVTPWQVSSYSAMVAGRTFDASEPQRLDEVRSTTEAPAVLEEDAGAQVDLGEPVSVPLDLDAPIATSDLHGGTDVGTWAHAVLEHLDFPRCAAHDGRDLHALIAELGTRHGVRSAQQHELLAAALPAVLDTPLDGRTGLSKGFSLRALQATDRLDELGFDLRLGEGNRWRYVPGESGGRLNQEGARLALQGRVGDATWGGDEWLRAILDRTMLEDKGVLPRIAGILTGFIDLVFRVEVPPDRVPGV
ncbi:MAG: UvrD-helicase domain-containing protein, partial [Deltaproteobacteria bacterium]|nr:UvrD-helicase domain-containing protein [Deltaproteobacteria bacterium]